MVGALILAALVDHAYSRFVYWFIVVPIGGVLLFPAAYAANGWLTSLISGWLSRYRAVLK